MKVTVITQTYCSWCTKVREFLSSVGVEATIVSIDHQGSTELRRLLESQGYNTVPLVMVDGEFIGGYQDTVSFFSHHVTDDQYSFGEILDD